MHEPTGVFDAAEVLSNKYTEMCAWNDWPIFEPVEDTALLASWLDAANTGEQLHALMSEDFSQGFLMGRILTMMENELAFEDEEGDDEAE